MGTLEFNTLTSTQEGPEFSSVLAGERWPSNAFAPRGCLRSLRGRGVLSILGFGLPGHGKFKDDITRKLYGVPPAFTRGMTPFDQGTCIPSSCHGRTIGLKTSLRESNPLNPLVSIFEFDAIAS